MHFEKKMKRDNVERAEELGALTQEKLEAGAPLSWKLVTGEEVEAIKAIGLPFIPRPNIHIKGPIALGWSTPEVYSMIIKWEEMDEQYADLTLTDWLRKTLA